MTTATPVRRSLGLGALAALWLLGLLALSACLPLQMGVEAPTPAQTAGTPLAQVSATTAAHSPTPALTPAPTTDPRTPVSGVTVTASSSPPATETSTEPPEPSLTPTTTDTPRPAVPECTLTHTVRQGERLTQIGALYGVPWQEIAAINGLQNPGLIFAGQVLCLPPNARAPSATPTRTPSATSSATPSPTVTLATPSVTPDLCSQAPAWFFAPTPPVCPAAVAVNAQAAAQRFERGQMLWVGTYDLYYVLFDGAGPSTRHMLRFEGPLNLKPGASPDNRVPETPPPGLEQPVSGFGLLWRGEVVGADSIRQALGWATQSEFGYATTYQCQATNTQEWNCYLRAPNGQILRLYYTPGVGYFWDFW